MRILFVGDIVGKAGRNGLRRGLPRLRDRLAPDAVLVNGENAAGGLGITPPVAEELFGMGVDAITLGNHAFRHSEVYPYLDDEPRIVRPANLPHAAPGRGSCLIDVGGRALGVINLMGMVQLEVARSPFAEAEMLVERLGAEAEVILVDFHAEVTSEKVAMGWHLDGRVAAVVGTHTHVPTADARVLPGGTAHITDVGMTGSRNGVIGVRTEQAVERFRTMLPVRFEGARGDVWIDAVLIEVGEDGRALSIEQVLEPVDQED